MHGLHGDQDAMWLLTNVPVVKMSWVQAREWMMLKQQLSCRTVLQGLNRSFKANNMQRSTGTRAAPKHN